MTPLNKVTTRQIQFISQFIQFQLRADASGTEMLILLLYLAVQLDLCRQVICNVLSTIKECLRRFIGITCAAKLFSNLKLELTCSNNSVAMW